MMKLKLFIVVFSILAVSCANQMQPSRDDDLHFRLVRSMKLVELTLWEFEKSYMEGCLMHQSENYCKNHMLLLDANRLEELYVKDLKIIFENSDLEGVVGFLETPNGMLFSEIAYKQNIFEVQYHPSMPIVTNEQIDAINHYRASMEWRSFERKMYQFQEISKHTIGKYILNTSMQAAEKLIDDL